MSKRKITKFMMDVILRPKELRFNLECSHTVILDKTKLNLEDDCSPNKSEHHSDNSVPPDDPKNVK